MIKICMKFHKKTEIYHNKDDKRRKRNLFWFDKR